MQFKIPAINSVSWYLNTQNQHRLFISIQTTGTKMSRYRPPMRKGSLYITPEGLQTLRAELHQLWKVERPQVTNVVHEAAKNGDRSENGDYIYGKRRLREIDSRVRFLSKRLDELEVVEQLPADQEKIYFGAWVTVEDEDGKSETYRIVGPDEFDLSLGKLSMDSPLARALLGKRIDDDIVFESPAGTRELYIAAVRYDAP
jgi:transcription elongation factor GreB